MYNLVSTILTYCIHRMINEGRVSFHNKILNDTNCLYVRGDRQLVKHYSETNG